MLLTNDWADLTETPGWSRQHQGWAVTLWYFPTHQLCLTPYSTAYTPSNNSLQICPYFYILCLVTEIRQRSYSAHLPSPRFTLN